MRIDPQIAALRGDVPAQRRAQARMEAARTAWRGMTDVVELEAQLGAYGTGRPLHACKALSRLMTSPERAMAFIEPAISGFVSALRDQPLGEAAWHTSCGTPGDGFSRVFLCESEGASLSLNTYEPRPVANAPRAVRVSDCELSEIVLAGHGEGWFHTVKGGEGRNARLATREQTLVRGTLIRCRPLFEARQVGVVRQTLLTLQLVRSPARPRPSIEYDCTHGTPMRRISGDREASRQIMALAVLGAMGLASHTTTMIAFAENRSHDSEARWEAVRQVLALDTAKGLALLARLADVRHDPLSQPAARLIIQLRNDHAALVAMMKDLA